MLHGGKINKKTLYNQAFQKLNNILSNYFFKKLTIEAIKSFEKYIFGVLNVNVGLFVKRTKIVSKLSKFGFGRDNL